jgi:hypothetical protein
MKIEKTQAPLYVDIACSLCGKSMAMSNAISLHGLSLCPTCFDMPTSARLIRLESLLIRAITSIEDRAPVTSRFQVQLAAAQYRNKMADKLAAVQQDCNKIIEFIEKGGRVDEVIMVRLRNEIQSALNLLFHREV